MTALIIGMPVALIVALIGALRLTEPGLSLQGARASIPSPLLAEPQWLTELREADLRDRIRVARWTRRLGIGFLALLIISFALVAYSAMSDGDSSAQAVATAFDVLLAWLVRVIFKRCDKSDADIAAILRGSQMHTLLPSDSV